MDYDKALTLDILFHMIEKFLYVSKSSPYVRMHVPICVRLLYLKVIPVLLPFRAKLGFDGVKSVRRQKRHREDNHIISVFKRKYFSPMKPDFRRLVSIRAKGYAVRQTILPETTALSRLDAGFLLFHRTHFWSDDFLITYVSISARESSHRPAQMALDGG